jgi:hypothetical protein
MATVITSQRLQAFLADCGLNLANAILRTPDSRYALVDKDWLARQGAVAIRAACAERVGLAEDDAADCDDFARCAAEEIRRIHRKTKGRPRGCGVAFGVWDYITRCGTGHWLNAVVSSPDAGESLQLSFFEPQRCRFVNLIPTEIQSCVNPEF